MGGELHLALEGQEQHGIRITGSTSLSYVRTNFPVPLGYIFGVPQRLEDRFKATDFLPLMLLRAEDCLQGKLGSTNAPANLKAERDRMEYEIAQLREAFARARDEHASKVSGLVARSDELGREAESLRARAHHADVLEGELKALREQMSLVEEESKGHKLAAQRENHELIAQLANANRESADAKAAVQRATSDALSLREQLAAAATGQQARLSATQGERRLLAAKCAALARVVSATRAAHARLRADAHRLLAEAARATALGSADAVRTVSGACALQLRAADAAKGAERQAAAARSDYIQVRAECDKARAQCDELRAELKRAKAERRQQSADVRRKESSASLENARLAAELVAARELAGAREREARKARADAEAHRLAASERERAAREEAATLGAQLRESESRVAALDGSASAARAMADAARQAQMEVEAAWEEVGGRRPITFAEYIELRREVQQLAHAGREFFVSPESGRQQAAFLTHVARVETMLTAARDGPALTRAAAASGVLPITQSKGLLSRAASVANVSAGAPSRERPSPEPTALASQRRNSVGVVSALGAGSHVHQMQGLRAKRQQLKAPAGLR